MLTTPLPLPAASVAVGVAAPLALAEALASTDLPERLARVYREIQRRAAERQAQAPAEEHDGEH